MIEVLSEGWPLYLAAGLFGLVVGSFLNVVILRLPERLMHDWRAQSREMLGIEPAAADAPAPPDIVFKRSHCPQCKHQLSVLDNIPLASWLVLRGRCRYCKAPISIQYPLVEALSAAATLVVVAKFGPTWAGAAGLALSYLLIALAGIDFRTQLLPDNLTLPLLWLGLLLSLQPVFVAPADAIVGAAIGYLSLWSIYWLFKLLTGKEGMGYGDFKLLGALGAWMGPKSLLPIVLLSSVVGAILGSIILATRGKDSSTPIPFGPFIAVAGWIQFIWGEQLLQLYTQVLFVR
ncbi:MAG TPA: A24 family peptidase [Tahibacter sp.]|uniref:prepilin peptidase n=1 Tax=Tahibacter sp. TaxID=2056211 RepID=UPI002D0E98A5|nr:A24 family peptidase [Tahibacter sp.]HSX59782.1 A24 family peptidase [Tahibacter sp.]